jgi:hypothetical protein
VAGHGPAPKDPAKRRRRNADPKATDTLVSDGEVRGPELPEGVLDDESWHPRTVQWWETWRRSAQAQTFTDTDWDFLLDTALMHHTMWSRQKWEFAAELRLRAAKFGATPEDRMRLRMEIETPGSGRPASPTPDQGSVTDISSRRARLTG